MIDPLGLANPLDEMVKEAEAKVTLLAAQEKEMVATFEIQANERKANLEIELSDMVK